MTARPMPLAVLLCGALVGGWGGAGPAEARDSARAEEYEALLGQYRAGETARAADGLAGWTPAAAARAARRLDCFHRADCEAAAVLHLEAAARCFESVRSDDAAAQIAAGRRILAKLGATVPAHSPSRTEEFLYGWHVAAGCLQQGYAFHADALGSYRAALEIRPGDPAARLARATAVEASVLTDGFGGVLAAGSLPPLIGYAPGRFAPGPRQRPDDPAGPYWMPLLRFLANEYRAVLGAGGPAGEARLRLGRVLAARGDRDEAVAELRRAAEEASDPFVRGLAHLCLGRLADKPEDAARWYLAATEADPSLRQAWVGRSEAAWRMRDRGAALAALERAFAGDDQRLTSWVEYHFGRGRAYAEALAALRARVVTGSTAAP